MCFLIVVLFLWSACLPAFQATPERQETGGDRCDDETGLQKSRWLMISAVKSFTHNGVENVNEGQ